MVKLDFDLQRDVPELTGKVLLITGGKSMALRPSHVTMACSFFSQARMA